MKRIAKNVVVSILGIILLFLSYWYFGRFGANLMSMTFMIIVIGIIAINILVWKQRWAFGKIEDMPILTVQFYYSEVFSTLRAVFTGFVIAFAILWGLQYSNGTSNTSNLQVQTALLLLLLVYLGFSSFYTFIQDLKHRIQE